MNQENILKLAEYMEGLEPSQYNQRLVVNCGTPSCIAGHAAYLAGYLKEYDRFEHDHPKWSLFYLGLARHWLGLNFSDSQHLFSAYPLEDEEWTPTLQDAAWTLRHLAETGEVVWQPDSFALY